VFVRRQVDPDLKDRARELRRRGASIKRIAAELGISPSTSSLWVSDVPLTEAQTRALRAQAGGDQRAAGAARRALALRERERAQADGRERARRRDDPLHQAGCMLYWAEGSRSANSVTFTNADVHMVRYFVRFLTMSYGVDLSDVTLTVNCHLGNGLSVEEIDARWCAELGLPSTSLRKAAVNRPSSASKGVRPPLIYGTARVSVHSTWIAQSILGAIQEYAGFDRREWLETDRARRAALRRAA